MSRPGDVRWRDTESDAMFSVRKVMFRHHIAARLSVPLLVILANVAYANVRVHVVDHPTWVLEFSPVFITVAVENTGNEPVFINAGSGAIDVWVGTSPNTLRRVSSSVLGTGPARAVWIKPGNKWLIQREIGQHIRKVGRYFVSMRVLGTGRCQLATAKYQNHELTLLVEQPGPLNIYECWSGEEMPATLAVDVKPLTAGDREVISFMRGPEFPFPKIDDLVFAARVGNRILRERFPASHLTLVGAFGSGPEALESVIAEQPQNPLMPYALMVVALRHLSMGELREGTIQGLEIPDELKLYLHQKLEERRKAVD